MEKLNLEPKTLDYKVVKDGLTAVSKLNDQLIGKDSWMIVGGIAVQGYLPSSCRRPTADIDLSIVKPLNYEEFKQITKPAIEFLQDIGYTVFTKKNQSNYGLNILGKEKKDTIILEVSRKSKNNFEKSRKRLERELENSRIKQIEDRSEVYIVSSPEDIAIPKLVRCIGSLKRNPNIELDLEEVLRDPNTEYISSILDQISYLRGTAHATNNPQDIERLRTISDIYDINLLSELVGFNKKYMSKVAKDWDVIQGELFQRKNLFELIFPQKQI